MLIAIAWLNTPNQDAHQVLQKITVTRKRIAEPILKSGACVKPMLDEVEQGDEGGSWIDVASHLSAFPHLAEPLDTLQSQIAVRTLDTSCCIRP